VRQVENKKKEFELYGKSYLWDENKVNELVKEILTNMLDKDSIDVEIGISKLQKRSGIQKKTLTKVFDTLKVEKERTELRNEVSISPEEKNECIKFLKNKDLLSKYLKDLSKKIVGEEKVIQSVFMSCIGMFVEEKLLSNNLIVNGEPSSGKSYVAGTVVKYFPKDKFEMRTRITPRVLNYWKNSTTDPDFSWDGMVLYLEDISEDVLNSEVLKVLVTEGSKCTVLMKQNPVDIEVNGKPIVITTTAKSEPQSEILERFNIVRVDESEEQTKRINEYQSKIAVGHAAPEYDNLTRLSLSILERVNVSIPYATKINVHFPSKTVTSRRSFEMFLSMIKSSCALHQFQRECINKKYVATAEDYEIARKIWNFMYDEDISKKPLVGKQKRAYMACLALSSQVGFTVEEAMDMDSTISQSYWYKVLEKFCEREYLTKLSEQVEGSIKPVNKYFLKGDQGKIILPSFEDLDKEPSAIEQITQQNENENTGKGKW
jgi:hypothetical protein